jgi:signal transduction histidine kinase/CheY-like chemotaxis protein/HAMP domain-containing protein
VPATSPFSSLRVRLAATVFIAVAPAAVVMYFTELPWMGFVIGLLALGAAWYGGERFVVRQLRVLLNSAKHLAAGDLSIRTELGDTKGEIGELARTFDRMAESIETRAREAEAAQRTLGTRAQQQTVVAALGQFALVSQDFGALINQSVTMIGQTLEVEFAHALELQPDGKSLLMRAGIGWKSGEVGKAIIEAHGSSQAAFVLQSGEPVVITNMKEERRFIAPRLLLEHGILSGIAVVISPRQQPFGVLGAYSKKQRSFTGDEINFMVGVAMALATAAERLSTEAELQKLAAFAQLNPNPALEIEADGTISYFNEAAQKLALSVVREHPREVLPENIVAIVLECLLSGGSRLRLETKIGSRTLSWSFHPVLASHVVHCYVEDITERLSLEAQLLQSQKMESVGQLAAGVAHDFNNMLTIIQGHSGMLMAKPNLPPEMFDSAQAVYFASERAASLTRQLLMFSRKNVIQRKELDLRDVVSNMIKLLKRLLGETVTLEFNRPDELPAVLADAGMLEQIIMNLAVNARDAMPRGGTLTINLSPTEVTPVFKQMHPEARVGSFVCLRVSDTGMGMDESIISHIFEPFFTTKEVGKGTGLGLATVYGIVKQHDGWIEVTSEIGKGSVFHVFFPATNTPAETTKRDSDPAAFLRGGDETILIVEDEPVLREMAHLILNECGYRIHDAATGPEALEVWNREAGAIDLLLTDMVMPEGVSGVELAEMLLLKKPELKVIFASGYTVDEVSEAFLEKNNARFLQKPYTRVSLARIVRQALDQTQTNGKR